MPPTMTWFQVEGSAEIKEAFYQHTSPDDLADFVRTEGIEKREQIEAFLDQLIKGYHGSNDFIDILQYLIMQISNHQCLKDVQRKLERLKYQKKLEKEMYSICNEEEMSGFPKYVHKNVDPDEHHSKVDLCPDTSTKLMYLMKLVLQIPKYYTAFDKFCKNRQALQKYITDGIPLTDEMIGYVSILSHFSNFVCD